MANKSGGHVSQGKEEHMQKLTREKGKTYRRLSGWQRQERVPELDDANRRLIPFELASALL